MGRSDVCRRSAPARASVDRCALARRPIDTQLLWPRLDTVSAWADGVSRPYARRLPEMLPHAALQPKGLLATEGAVTTPCSVLLAGSGADERIPGIHRRRRPARFYATSCATGESYRVVMTTPGGLYRYDLGDRLRCHGYAGRACRCWNSSARERRQRPRRRKAERSASSARR